MVIAAGKSRKNVDAFVFFPPNAKQAIDLLIKTREMVGVPSTNPYIFARMKSNTPFSGNSDLREIVDSCPNISFPNRINSTSLRKYIATVSQVCTSICCNQSSLQKQTNTESRHILLLYLYTRRSSYLCAFLRKYLSCKSH